MEYFKLNNGEKIPALNFGVYEIDIDKTKEAVLKALDIGYRAIDNAQIYYNEKEVGKAIKESDVPREEIFLTSKNWVSNAGYDKTIKAFNKTLEDLQTDYLDLLLIHQPYGDYYGSYRALQDLQKEGKVISIGLSNFYPDRLIDLVMNNDVLPQVNQVETTPYFQQYEANEVMKKLGVSHQAWGPFSEGMDNLFENPILKEIADKYSKSTGQVILRWLIDRDISIACRSVREDRMKENIDIFDFKLSKTDIEKIKEIDRGESPFIDHTDPETVEEFNEEII
ncbi:2,5-diketo-D-gluconic acid reductase [Methanobrevibacter sp. YE315]|uniref:aldo/keto reductase n=1 Tax=Methanobrevibacter sp. YE315 TaxID=1609968 RepID=UPI000764F0AB|nr:aldo/keto reductase [Methanobrevibacter sp. YE315]AMD17712.1 2,5-diketo-D-gluconic acid reductase [Methanobrevibacter sp. YE315]